MSLRSRLFGNSKEEIASLKQDVKDLTQFSTLQSIDQQTFDLTTFNKGDSTNFDDNVLIDLWSSVPEISTVISKISDRAKSVPWEHFKLKGNGSVGKMNSAMNDYIQGKCAFSVLKQLREKNLEPIYNTEVDRLLKNPNDLQSWSEMIEQLISYWYVLGNSYLIKLGAFAHIPDELNVMASQQTDVIIKKSFLDNPFQVNKTESAIDHYTFDNGQGKIITFNDPEIIIHLKAPNLIYKNKSWVKGYSPLASAILASKTLKQEYISRLSLVRDRGAMGAMVGDAKSGGQLPTPDQTESLYKRLSKFGLGDGKQSPFMATNGNYKWINMSFNSSELELLKGREENLKTLCRKMNVPTDLVIGDSTFNNADASGKLIYTSNVIPWLDNFQQKLNKTIGLTERNEVIMPVYDDIAELQQDLKVQTEIMSTQWNNGLATKEEARDGIGRPEKAQTDNYKGNNENNNSNGIK